MTAPNVVCFRTHSYYNSLSAIIEVYLRKTKEKLTYPSMLASFIPNPRPTSKAQMLKTWKNACSQTPPMARINKPPMGISTTTVVPMMAPWAF